MDSGQCQCWSGYSGERQNMKTTFGVYLFQMVSREKVVCITIISGIHQSRKDKIKVSYLCLLCWPNVLLSTENGKL